MRIGTLSLAAVAAAALVGCASPGTFRPMYFPGYTNVFIKSVKCTTADCSLSVTVTEDGGVCKLDVAEVLDVTEGPVGARNITWTIETAGYEFSKESYKYGIFIKSDPDEEFKNVQITASGKSLSLKFEHNAPGAAYSYALTARRTSGNKAFCKTLDPWLIT
jgi:hypothetical protein